jgi:phosphohistidine phosphatase SixA
MIVLLRHASAGERDEWDDDDRLRPLDERGHEQARLLVDALSSVRVARVLTSPYVRCVQTVEPLAAARGLAVEQADALAEGAGRDAALALAADAGADALLCTHGDVVEALLEAGLKKGAAALLETDDAARVRIVGSFPTPA